MWRKREFYGTIWRWFARVKCGNIMSGFRKCCDCRVSRLLCDLPKEWDSCRLFHPKGAGENNCALQHASLVINSLSVSWFELVRIWSEHRKVRSEKVCGVLLKCMATSQVFLLVFMDDLRLLNLTLNLVLVEQAYWRFCYSQAFGGDFIASSLKALL